MTPSRANKEASVLRAVDEATAAIKAPQFKKEPHTSTPGTDARVLNLCEHAHHQGEVIEEMKVMIEQLLDEQQQLKQMLQDLSAEQAINTAHILTKLKTIAAISSSSSGPSTSRPNTLVDELPVACEDAATIGADQQENATIGADQQENASDVSWRNVGESEEC
jgi:hypothetical protein